jgi:ATP-dependent RNA helicase DHX36
VDRSLKGVSHVIVDEIHERGMNEGSVIIVSFQYCFVKFNM